eukprot:gene9155-18966_t
MPSFDEKLSETFTAPTNSKDTFMLQISSQFFLTKYLPLTIVAVIKYWGKDSLKLNTPLNSSFSVTLDQKDLHTITSVAASRSFDKDRFWLNGKEVEINNRGKTCLNEIRALAQDRKDEVSNKILVKKEDWPLYKLHIASVNTFPTGAGLASSAAGLACFVATLAKLYGVQEEYPGQLSGIARQGSGSASRSMYGGFVRWQKGDRPDGKDSIAVQLADHQHWPEMRAVVLVVSDKEKDTSSTSGMETSKATSPLLLYRAANVVQPRLDKLEEAVSKKDFQSFGLLTMQDSNQFHATCLDTYPPIFYMNDVSKSIIRLVHVLNENAGKIVAAYTFDAGPNAVIYTLIEYEPLVVAVMGHYFPAPGSLLDYCNDAALFQQYTSSVGLLTDDLVRKLDKAGRVPVAGDVKFVFLTRPGPGPIPQAITESLLDPNTGLPLPPTSKHKRLEIPSAGGGRSHTLVPAPVSKLLVAVGVVSLSLTLGFVFGRTLGSHRS